MIAGGLNLMRQSAALLHPRTRASFAPMVTLPPAGDDYHVPEYAGNSMTCLKLINSLTAIGGHDRPLIYELRAHVVSLRIFVRYQRLMARKIAELFGLNRGVRPFYAACCFDELSRGSFSCLLNASFKTAVSQRHNLIF
jgi:hypothetical protein